MAFLKKAFCCCKLRTGVIVIAALSFLEILWGLFSSVYYVTMIKVDEEQYRNFTKKEYEQLKILSKWHDVAVTLMGIEIGGNAVFLLATVALLVVALPANRYIARPYRIFILFWVVWNCVLVIYNTGFATWTLQYNLHQTYASYVAFSTAFTYVINIPFNIYFFVVAVAFYRELREDTLEYGGVIIRQPSESDQDVSDGPILPLSISRGEARDVY